jgi:hypothetical protein
LNPYPNENEKKFLSQQTGLTVQQIANWMDNHRRRYPEWKQGRPPNVESTGPRVRTEDENEEPIPSVTSLTLDDDLIKVLEKTDTVSADEQLEVQTGPSKDEARAIRAHNLLMSIGIGRMLDMKEKEFNLVISKYRHRVLNDYEGCPVISEHRAMELWKDATMQIYQNSIEYEKSLDAAEVDDDAYRNMLRKNKTVEKDLWENLLNM